MICRTQWPLAPNSRDRAKTRDGAKPRGRAKPHGRAKPRGRAEPRDRAKPRDDDDCDDDGLCVCCPLLTIYMYLLQPREPLLSSTDNSPRVQSLIRPTDTVRGQSLPHTLRHQNNPHRSEIRKQLSRVGKTLVARADIFAFCGRPLLQTESFNIRIFRCWELLSVVTYKACHVHTSWHFFDKFVFEIAFRHDNESRI